MTIAFDTFRRYGRPERQQQSALFFGILLSQASVYCCDVGQMTRPRPVPKHHLLWREAASRLSLVRKRLFFLHLPQLWMWVSVIMVLARQDDNVFFLQIYTKSCIFTPPPKSLQTQGLKVIYTKNEKDVQPLISTTYCTAS